MIIQRPLHTRDGLLQSARTETRGLQPHNTDVQVIARKTVTLGEVLMFDMGQTDAGVGSATVGADDSAWRNVIAPTAAGLAAGYPLCVALGAIVDDAAGFVRVQGIVDADLAGTNVVGDRLVATTSGNLDQALSNPTQRVVGWAMAAGATEQEVYFDGLQGWGPSQNPLPAGLEVPNVDIEVTARKTVGAGEIVMLDMAQSDAATTDATLGASTSCWTNVIAPTAEGIAAGYTLAVALAAITDDVVGTVRVAGVVAADLAGTNVIGDRLIATTAGTLARALSGVEERQVGIALVAGATTQSVMFEGRAGGLGATQNPLPTGLQVPNVDILATNRTGSAMNVGDVVMLDMIQTDTGTTNATLGDAGSCWANVLVPTTATIVAGLPLCVALDTAGNDVVGSFRISGIVGALMAASVGIGDDLVGVNAALTLDLVVAATEHVYAVALTAGTGVQTVWFRGVGGFGGAA